MFLEQLCTIAVLHLWLKSTNRSSIDIEGIRTVFVLYFFFYERYFKCKKHKQKHLSNIQPDISKSKKASKLTFNQKFS